jgi:hypothetical protein
MNPRCHFCSSPCSADCFCYGCSHYICESCEHPVADERPQCAVHEPEAHRAHVVQS